MIKITSIRIKKNKRQVNGLLGVASVQFENCLAIHNIKLIKSGEQRFIAFPSIKIKKFDCVNGKFEEKYEYSDIVHPINNDFRNYIQTELFKVYDMEVSKNNE